MTPPTPPDAATRLEVLIELYKQQFEHYRSSRDLEWKANFALWALLAGACYFVFEKGVTAPWYGLILFLVALAAAHGRWLYLFQKSQEVDKKLVSQYRHDALGLVLPGLRNPRVDEPAWRDDGKEAVWGGHEKTMSGQLSWVLLEVLVTSSLSLACLYGASRPARSAPPSSGVATATVQADSIVLTGLADLRADLRLCQSDVKSLQGSVTLSLERLAKIDLQLRKCTGGQAQHPPTACSPCCSPCGAVSSPAPQ